MRCSCARHAVAGNAAPTSHLWRSGTWFDRRQWMSWSIRSGHARSFASSSSGKTSGAGWRPLICFCLTSDREGLPNVVLEAMAAGLPVICTDFESAHEVLPDTSLGIIIPRNADAILAETALALLDDPERARRLGDAARAHVRTEFSWEKLVREMESLYGEFET